MSNDFTEFSELFTMARIVEPIESCDDPELPDDPFGVKFPVTPAAGWAQQGGAREPATFSRVGRYVQLQGSMIKTSVADIAAAELICTIGENWAPEKILLSVTWAFTTVPILAMLEIRPNGQIANGGVAIANGGQIPQIGLHTSYQSR